MPAQPDTFPASHGASFAIVLAALRASALALIAATLFVVLPAGSAWSQSDPVVAKVNGVEIRESDLAMAEEDVGQNPQLQAMAPEARRDYMVSYLADVILAAKAAEGKKVADREGIQGPPRLQQHERLREPAVERAQQPPAKVPGCRRIPSSAARRSTS